MQTTAPTPTELKALRGLTAGLQALGRPSAQARITAALDSASEKRQESLLLAIEAGADADTIETLAAAERLSRGDTIVLPQGRYAHCSRGYSWCRRSDGEWAPRDEHRVGPGKYKVGSSDGFSRKERGVSWTVEHVTLPDGQVWTVAS